MLMYWYIAAEAEQTSQTIQHPNRWEGSFGFTCSWSTPLYVTVLRINCTIPGNCLLFQFNNITFTGKFIATSKLHHHIFASWNPKLFQEQKYLAIMSYYFILVMASSQLNTLSCRWDSCYGWGRYLRFLFDQLQTFRFWAMSQDLSWLEVFRWSNDQAGMQRHEIEYRWFCHCWMLILV